MVCIGEGRWVSEGGRRCSAGSKGFSHLGGRPSLRMISFEKGTPDATLRLGVRCGRGEVERWRRI